MRAVEVTRRAINLHRVYIGFTNYIRRLFRPSFFFVPWQTEGGSGVSLWREIEVSGRNVPNERKYAVYKGTIGSRRDYG